MITRYHPIRHKQAMIGMNIIQCTQMTTFTIQQCAIQMTAMSLQLYSVLLSVQLPYDIRHL